MTHFKSNIRYLRTRLGKSQEEMATIIGINRSAMAAWEEGRSYCRHETLIILSDFYGTTIDELLKVDLSATGSGIGVSPEGKATMAKVLLSRIRDLNKELTDILE